MPLLCFFFASFDFLFRNIQLFFPSLFLFLLLLHFLFAFSEYILYGWVATTTIFSCFQMGFTLSPRPGFLRSAYVRIQSNQSIKGRYSFPKQFMRRNTCCLELRFHEGFVSLVVFFIFDVYLVRSGPSMINLCACSSTMENI